MISFWVERMYYCILSVGESLNGRQGLNRKILGMWEKHFATASAVYGSGFSSGDVVSSSHSSDSKSLFFLSQEKVIRKLHSADYLPFTQFVSFPDNVFTYFKNSCNCT